MYFRHLATIRGVLVSGSKLIARRNKVPVDAIGQTIEEGGMAHVRGEVLGSCQPDRLVVFTLQHARLFLCPDPEKSASKRCRRRSTRPAQGADSGSRLTW